MATDRSRTRSSSRPAVLAALTAPARAGALVLAGLLLWAMWCAIKLGRAESVADGVLEDQLEWRDRLTRTGGLPSMVEWQETAAELAQARRLDPANPRMAEQEGQLYLATVKDGTRIKDFGLRAIAPFAEAVALRPSSPYAWSNLAWAKYYVGQVDKMFFAALSNAARLGPWEKEVQLQVVDLGLALWNEMPAAARGEVLATARNAQRRFAAEVVAIAQRRGRLAEVCGFEQTATKPACKMLAEEQSN